MTKNNVPIGRVIEKLDDLLSRNDYEGAERHLLYWLKDAEVCGDNRSALTICNECIGLFRKRGKKSEALKATEEALSYLEKTNLKNSITGATTYINTATAYKAFGKANDAMPLFKKAETIYEKELKSDDGRLGGLYNNMALALVDIKEFKEAKKYYEKALSVMEKVENGELERAITYLNIASAVEAENGLEEASGEISNIIEKAKQLLDMPTGAEKGYYAFVCEKCASTFGYYGYFLYEQELLERANKIYERD